MAAPWIVRAPGRLGAVGLVTMLAVQLAGCTAYRNDHAESERPVPGPATSTTGTPGPVPSSVRATPSTATASSPPPPSPRPAAGPFDPDRALRTVELLAGEIGPREATSTGFDRAADHVEDELSELGFDVSRERVPVPAGDSWGVRVPSGTSANLIAERPGFDPGQSYVIIGAHLDTVPQAPGAEDNASGIAVLLELARMLRGQPVDVQVRLIAFGAEEPRGSGDANHHFGSLRHVRNLSGSERGQISAMVSLDRVGVRGRTVPVCFGGQGSSRVRRSLVEAAGRIPTSTCQNRSSDHWPFEKTGVPAARIGSIPYSGYHSAADVPSVVDRRQLDRVGRLMWSWLTSLP